MSRTLLRYKLTFSGLGLALSLLTLVVLTPSEALAACSAQPTDKGVATMSISIPQTGNYRVWSRLMAPDTTANSYLLEIDSTTATATCGVVVGDNAFAANTWTWVDHRDGNTSSKINLNLTAGTHTVTMIGREAGVKLDRLIFTMDTSCVPSGTGDNCASPPDVTPPTVSITAPTNNASVSGNVTINATATDDFNSPVSKVEFLVDNVKVGEDTSSPFSYTWNSTTATNGNHNLTARAFDMANNTSTSTQVVVTVSGGVSPPPSTLVADMWGPAGTSDGVVNLLDFSKLASQFGQSGSGLVADIWGPAGTPDGVVNLLDFSKLASQFGQTSGN